MIQAALGTEMDVPTLNSSKKLTIPKGTQNGQTFIPVPSAVSGLVG